MHPTEIWIAPQYGLGTLSSTFLGIKYGLKASLQINGKSSTNSQTLKRAAPVFLFLCCCNLSPCQSVYFDNVASARESVYFDTTDASSLFPVFLFLCCSLLLQSFSLPECLLWHDRCTLTDPQFPRSLLHITLTSHRAAKYLHIPHEMNCLSWLWKWETVVEKATEIEFASAKPAMFSSFPEAWVVLLYCRLPFRQKHNEVGGTPTFKNQPSKNQL